MWVQLDGCLCVLAVCNLHDNSYGSGLLKSCVFCSSEERSVLCRQLCVMSLWNALYGGIPQGIAFVLTNISSVSAQRDVQKEHVATPSSQSHPEFSEAERGNVPDFRMAL